MSASTLIPSRPLVWICRGLCTVALVISSYLAWTAFTAQPVVGCGAGEIFDCSHVLTSPWSKVYGIPVSVPAVGMYASLLVVLGFLRTGVPSSMLNAGWSLMTVGAFSAGLAALWFIGLQMFVLKHYCPWCLAAHACGIILASIVMWKRPLGSGTTVKLSSVSVAGIAALISAQVMVPPPDNFVVERFDDTNDVGENFAADEFSAPAEFAPPTAFEAPVAFEAPMEFAPPGGSSPTVFAPPVAETADVVENIFEPPAAALEADAPNPAAIETANPNDKDDSDPDVTDSDDDSKSEVSPVVAASTILFFSPSASSLLTRLPGLVNVSAAETDAAKEQCDESTEASKKPHAVQKPGINERLVSVAGQKFSLNTRHWPLIGQPDAKYVFVEMFDYTCSHCRHTHHAVHGALQTLGSDLAIIALPVPLDPACNDAVSSSGHAGACELAKLSVAVWRCDQSKFAEYHDWMFQSQRSSSAAKRKAEELVGKEKLATELALPHAKSYVAKHIELYKRVGKGAVPKLMFPKSTMTGQVSSASTLVSTIRRELGD